MEVLPLPLREFGRAHIRSMAFREGFIVLLYVQPVIWYNAAAARARSVFSAETGSGPWLPPLKGGYFTSALRRSLEG